MYKYTDEYGNVIIKLVNYVGGSNLSYKNNSFP